MPRDDAVPPTPARHSLLQIFVGASIGFPLGVAAFWCDPHGRLLQKPLKDPKGLPDMPENLSCFGGYVSLHPTVAAVLDSKSAPSQVVPWPKKSPTQQPSWLWCAGNQRSFVPVVAEAGGWEWFWHWLRLGRTIGNGSLFSILSPPKMDN
jgi:hypothetical protein